MSVAPCPPSSITPPGVVVFDPAAFKASFPEFSTVADGVLTMNFQLATLQLGNSCGSQVCNPGERELLLNLLTAHITQLRNGINGQPAQGIVGRIDKATEGSVSVGAGMGVEVYGQPYYDQTQFGALYWQSTAQYRTFMYMPAAPVCADFGVAAVLGPNPWLGGGWGGGGCGC